MEKKVKAHPETKTNCKKKKILSIGLLIVGIITLIVGVVFLVINLIAASNVADGEYLVAADSWVMEDSEGVVWDFTEIGKGTLTTNNHLNDYDFAWSIEDGKLTIKTDWLYELDNEYEYQLDQSSGTLTLKDGEGTYKFKAK